MNFYRYDALVYAADFGDYKYSKQFFTSLQLRLSEYVLHKETPKGYWICQGSVSGLTCRERWISKTAKKRFAYPTKDQALIAFIKRTEKRKAILEEQIVYCKLALNLANDQLGISAA